MSLVSGLFKTQKTPTYSGSTPYSSLMEAKGGPEYYSKILARSNGEGVGYSPDYVDKASNPVIARMRGQFNSYDLPELKSELTATGRRSGSTGFGQIAKAYEHQGLNEEAAYAPIYAASQEARRSDINSAIPALGAFNAGDYNAKNTAAGFERSTFDTSTKNNQYDRAANDARAANLLNYGQDSMGVLFGGDGAMKRQPPPIQYGGQTYETSTPPPGQQDYYTQMLARNVKQGQKGSIF